MTQISPGPKRWSVGLVDDVHKAAAVSLVEGYPVFGFRLDSVVQSCLIYPELVPVAE